LVAEYAQEAQRSSPETVVVEIAGADHFKVVDASSEAFLKTLLPALSGLVRKHFGETAAMALES